MTDAERVAKAWADLLGVNYANPAQVERLQRLIDAGVITVNPPPDPAEQIVAEFIGLRRLNMSAPDVLRSMLADETIVPGPRCEGYEPQPDPLAQAVLDAAEAYVDAHWPNGQQAMATHSRALTNAVRARREAQP